MEPTSLEINIISYVNTIPGLETLCTNPQNIRQTIDNTRTRMKSTAVLGSLALGGLAAGQTVQSKPFNLLVQSGSKELDGRALSTCHTGAAIESICLLSDAKAVFNLNTTEGVQPGPGGLSGVLAWTLPSRMYHHHVMSEVTAPSVN